MFDRPKHDYPSGCLLLKRDIDHHQKVFWNQAEKGSRHPYAQAICLNPGNYIQLYSMFLYIIRFGFEILSTIFYFEVNFDFET